MKTYHFQNDRDDARKQKIARRRELMRQEEIFLQEQEEEEERGKSSEQHAGIVQSKSDLKIGDSHDEHEREADAVAKKVVSGNENNVLQKMDDSTIRRSHEEEEKEGTLMAKGEDGGLHGTEQLQAKLDSSKGGGQSLDTDTKSEMEQKMGADLSDVKIHTDSNAHQMAEGINAKAFTHGQDIYFKQGNYDTNSDQGKELLAHELTHTQQQKGGVGRMVQRQAFMPYTPSKFDLFKSDLFKNSQELLDILHGPKVIQPGDQDLITSGTKPGDKALVENGPIHLIVQALLNTKYQTVNMPYATGVYSAISVAAVKKLQEEAGLATNGIIDSATVSYLDQKEYDRVSELLTAYPDKGSKELVYQSYSETIPSGRAVTLVNPKGKVRIYRALAFYMDDLSNVVAEVDANTKAIIVKEETPAKEFYDIQVDSGGMIYKGIVKRENIDARGQEVFLPQVEVVSYNFSYLDESKMTLLASDKISLYGDQFNAQVYYKPGGDSISEVANKLNVAGFFVLRLSYLGEGISDHRLKDIVIPGAEFGFDTPLNIFNKSGYVQTWADKDGISIRFGVKNNFIADAPMKPADATWTERGVVIKESRSLNTDWSPAANKHNFSYEGKNGRIEFGGITVVPAWAQKKGDAGNEITLDFSKSQASSARASLSITLTRLKTLLTPLPILKAPISWMSGMAFADRSLPQWVALQKQVEADSSKKDSQLNAFAAGTLAEVSGYALDSLNGLLGLYLGIDDYDKGKVDANLLVVREKFLQAVSEAYSDPKKATATLKEAIAKREFVETKINAFSVQRGGNTEKALGMASKTFFTILGSSQGRSADNMVLDAIIYSELRKQSTAAARSRGDIFGGGGQVPDKLPESFLSAEMLNSLIMLMSMHYSLMQADKLYDPNKSHWLGVSSEHAKYTVYMGTMASYMQAIRNAYDKPALTTNYEITQQIKKFFRLLNEMGDFNKYMEALMEDIKNTKLIEEIVPEVIKTVLEFVIAELITFGLATEFLAPWLIETGISITNAVRIMNAFRFVVSTVIFTAEGYITSNDPNKSFLKDLGNNLVVFALLRGNSALFSAIFKPQTAIGVGAKFLAEQAAALAILQQYANISYYLTTGTGMNEEQKDSSLYSNAAMITAFSISGLIMKNSFAQLYGDLSLRIIERESAKLNGMAEEIGKLQAGIAEASQNLRRDGKVTPEYIQLLTTYFEKQNLMFDELAKKAKPSEKAELGKSKERVQKQYSDLLKQIELQQMVLSDAIPEAIRNSKTFELIGKDRIKISRSDKITLEKIYTENGGTFEPLVDASGQEIKRTYAATMNGKTIYFETTRERGSIGPLARMKEMVKAENQDWKTVKKEFGIGETQPEIEVLRMAWTVDNWRPGQPVPEKYKIMLEEIKGQTAPQNKTNSPISEVTTDNGTVNISPNPTVTYIEFRNSSDKIISKYVFNTRTELENWAAYCNANGGYKNPGKISDINPNMHPWFYENGKRITDDAYYNPAPQSGAEKTPKAVYELYDKSGNLIARPDNKISKKASTQIELEYMNGYGSESDAELTQQGLTRSQVEARKNSLEQLAADFTPLEINFGDFTVRFDKVSIIHLFARHVKSYYLGEKREEQSWLPDDTTPESLIALFREMAKNSGFVEQLRKAAKKNGDNKNFIYEYNGKNYQVALGEGNRVMQFWPTANK